MIRTFIDAGILIYAARCQGEISEKALDFLEDDNREFASSIFLKLEVLPKSIYNQNLSEVKFYEAFFDQVSYWADDIHTIIEIAYEQSSKFGLGAMDALHIGAALSVGATEFITNEKPGRSIHRTPSLQIISIHSEINRDI